jgi:hypothetical protein
MDAMEGGTGVGRLGAFLLARKLPYAHIDLKSIT